MLPLFVVLVLGVFTQQTFADEPDAIVGGSPAAPGEFSHQVSLRKNGRHFCGGTIVSPRCIVTAAHCLVGIAKPPNYNDVTVVSSTLSSRTGTQHQVWYGRIHPKYKGQRQHSWEYDAAVLVLYRPMQFNSYRKPVQLASQTPSGNTQCVVSGWGKTSTTSSVSPNLRKANVKVVDRGTCQNLYRSQPITERHLCTLAQRGIGSCQGDSGGPLMCGGKLAGIVSWVRLPCGSGIPDVFCDVAAVYDFIRPYL